MAKDYAQILSDLNNGNYAPLYFLEGEEPFFIDQIVKYIEENALEESQRSFNQMILYGKDCKMEDVFSQARRFPVMAERQVVIVKEAQEISDFSKEIGAKHFENYLKSIVPSTILVFAYKYKKLDKRKPLAKTIDKNAILFSSKKIYENELEKWVNTLIKQKGLEADPKAVFLIAENIGMDLSRIDNELEKIKLNLEKGQKLDADIVHKNIGISREYNVWELQKAFASGNRKKVFDILAYFERNPKSAPLVTILPTLYNLYSKILVIQQRGLNNPKALQDELGVNYYAAQEYLAGAKFYPRNKIPYIIASLRGADAQQKGIKAAQMKESEILKELALRILY